jgi:hypothetical protein
MALALERWSASRRRGLNGAGMDKRLLDYRPEMEFLGAPAGPAAGAAALPELELTAQLLEVADEGQLERFVADLVGAAGPRGRAARATPAGRALAAALKDAARRVLPIHSGAAGGGAAGRHGGDLKSRAARIFGIELEGLSPEDKEFEVAQRFVRFASAAARDALGGGAAASAASAATAQAALLRAARRHAPGLLQGAVAAQGSWRRERGCIVLLDV